MTSFHQFFLIFINLIVGVQSLSVKAPSSSTSNNNNIKSFHFGGGCFWAPDDNLKNKPGIISSSVGYCGDDTPFRKIPTYDKICGGRTNLVEAVRVEYDATQVSYEDMLNYFAEVNTAEWANKRQYKGIIFTSDKDESKKAVSFLKQNIGVVAEVEPMSKMFYKAERYHQNYWGKWRTRGLSLLAVLGGVGTYGEEYLGDALSQKVYNGLIFGFVLFTLVERRFFYGQEAIAVE